MDHPVFHDVTSVNKLPEQVIFPFGVRSATKPSANALQFRLGLTPESFYFKFDTTHHPVHEMEDLYEK